MPTYEYMCKKCGPFTQLRPMAECDLPSACPECRARSPRVILTAPGCLTMSAEEQRARMRSMRNLVQEFNVFRWAGRMLLDAARMRHRRRVLARTRAARRTAGAA